MKSFARHRSSRSKTAEVPTDAPLLDLDALDIAPLSFSGPPAPDAPAEEPSAPALVTADAATAENDEFVERLGDLDRFIGGSAAPVSWSPSTPTRNLPAAPTAAVAPISHPRPPAPSAAAGTVDDHADWDPTEVDSSDDFVERLGDLDRFIGGTPAPAPTPAPTAAPAPAAASATAPPAADTEDEAQEFLDRLGDLDRFIGGANPPES